MRAEATAVLIALVVVATVDTLKPKGSATCAGEVASWRPTGASSVIGVTATKNMTGALVRAAALSASWNAPDAVEAEPRKHSTGAPEPRASPTAWSARLPGASETGATL